MWVRTLSTGGDDLRYFVPTERAGQMIEIDERTPKQGTPADGALLPTWAQRDDRSDCEQGSQGMGGLVGEGGERVGEMGATEHEIVKEDQQRRDNSRK
jgi:hypothetical protein